MPDDQDRHDSFPPVPPSFRRTPERIMHMGPLVITLGAMLVFFLVVGFVVVLPLTTFEPEPSPNSIPLSDAAWRGKQMFAQEGCYLCHSGFSRPQDVAIGQYYTYTRVSEAGDWPGADWTPNLFGSIRTGPDLSNEAGHHPEDWHRAHYFDPRYTMPRSVMPRFSFWSEEQVTDMFAFNSSLGGKAGVLRTAAIQVGGRMMTSNMAMTSFQELFPELIEAVGDAYRPDGAPSDRSPSGLPWMAVWMMNSFQRSYWLTKNPLPVTQQNLIRGKLVFQERCVGCHGVAGDGRGPARRFLTPPPFDFTNETKMMGPAASPGQMYHRILTAGPGTAMENFGTRLSVEDIWRVVLFLRTIPNGSLATPETLPTADMYMHWEPPGAMLRYIEEHPLSADAGPSHELGDPFESAARWVAPGMAPGDVIYVGGKLPMTLERLAGEIRRTYFDILTQAFEEARARGQTTLSREHVMSTEGLAWAQP